MAFDLDKYIKEKIDIPTEKKVSQLDRYSDLVNDTDINQNNKLSDLERYKRFASKLGTKAVFGGVSPLIEKGLEKAGYETKLKPSELIQTGAELAPIALGGAGAAMSIPKYIGIQSAITAGSKLIEELAKGKSPQEAIKKTVAPTALTAGLTGTTKVLFNKLPSFILKSRLLKDTGEYAGNIIKKEFPEITAPIMKEVPELTKHTKPSISILKREPLSKEMRDKEIMKQTPKLIEKIKSSIPFLKKSPMAEKQFEDITNEAILNIKTKEEELGKIVGSAKEAAVKTGNTINGKPLLSAVDETIKEHNLLSNGILDYKNVAKPTVLRKVVDLIKSVAKSNNTPEELFDLLSKTDSHLATIFTKKIKKEKLAASENAAIRIYGKINDYIMNNVSPDVKKAKMDLEKLKYILSAEGFEIGNALKTTKGMYDLFLRSIQPGKRETLINLQKLDKLLPEGQKFINPILSKISRLKLIGSEEFFPTKAGIITPILATTRLPIARMLAKTKKPAFRIPAGMARATLIKQMTKTGE